MTHGQNHFGRAHLAGEALTATPASVQKATLGGSGFRL